MSSKQQQPTKAASPATDDFRTYLRDAQSSDAQFRAAYEDAVELQAVLDDLVTLRKTLGLSQTTVAARMGVRQPTVSEFETESSDPRLSTLQRYARAVEARLRFTLDLPACCPWVPSSTVAYQPRPDAVRLDERPRLEVSDRAREWQPTTSDWALAG